MSRLILGVDVGGTFTDFVAYDEESARVSAWKNLTVADDPTSGILHGLAALASIEAVAVLRMGTTVATNAILERQGARVAYVTTRGFRDIPFLQRGNRASHYDSAWVKPKPLVLRRHCFELDERVMANGEILTPLDEASVYAAAAAIRAAGDIEAVAVNLLFAYVEPRHEQRVREILAAELDGMPISISSEVLPKWKEYERASTVLADAYIKPVVHRYLGDMRNRLAAAGVRAEPVVIRSNGGEMTLDAAAEQPVHLTLSGPTGGVVAAEQIAQELKLSHLVTLDMGGTSTDCSTIVNGEISFTTDFEIEFGMPIQVPMIDIRTIGAGGGSIARIDSGGMLRVGPHSAGAQPGPACYGQGGTAATVTDANVVLGRINPDNFLGGGMALDVDAAYAAIARLAATIDFEPEQTALAMLRIVNNNMVGALRTVLIERGLDPRDFSLLGFGGAGPLHVCDLMAEAGIPRAIVPLYPGQFSALGFIFSDPQVDLERTVQMTSARFDRERADAALAELIERATTMLKAQGHERDITVQTSVELRYLGQNYELEIPFVASRFGDAELSHIWDSFHARHEQRYGFAIRAEVIEVITLKCRAVVAGDRPTLARLEDAAQGALAGAERPVWFEQGPLPTAIYARADLRPGHRIAGPALIEEDASVTVVRPDYELSVTPSGHLLLAGS